MSVAPAPSAIFERAVEEGERRLDASPLEKVSSAFIAGFTIVFGIVGLGLTHSLTAEILGDAAKIAGALAFGLGVVFLVVGRAELFNENFFDPVATAFKKRESSLIPRILRLWGVTFVFNLIGGVLLVLVMSVPGVLPEGTRTALRTIAEEIARGGGWGTFMSAVLGGGLVSLLSFMLQGVNSVGSRIAMAYVVGFLLALGSFNHVIVTALQLFAGILFGATVGLGQLGALMAIGTAGNLVGGVGLVTLSHVAQAGGRN